jgi:hypothetical protein
MLLDGIDFEPKRLITKFRTPLITTKTVDRYVYIIKIKVFHRFLSYLYVNITAFVNNHLQASIGMVDFTGSGLRIADYGLRIVNPCK